MFLDLVHIAGEEVALKGNVSSGWYQENNGMLGRLDLLFYYFSVSSEMYLKDLRSSTNIEIYKICM